MKLKLSPRVDRFINFMESVFGVEDTDMLYSVYALMEKGKLTFWELIKPYLESCLKDPDLITRSILLNNYLVIRLGYANGSCKLHGEYTTTELKFILEDFEKVIGELKGKIGDE